MIAEVIRDASTEHEIYFFLTAYIEAVRFCDKLDCLPTHITGLPLAGIDDLRGRFRTLELGKASNELDEQAGVVIGEALAIFGAALDRLGSLDGEMRRPLRGIDAQAA